MPRLLNIRYFLPLLLNLTGRRLPPLIEVLTGYSASVFFNLALYVRLIPKTHLSIYIFFFFLFGCGHALLSLDYRLVSLELFFLLFTVKTAYKSWKTSPP